jgi:hypothetical protein
MKLFEELMGWAIVVQFIVCLFYFFIVPYDGGNLLLDIWGISNAVLMFFGLIGIASMK